MALERCTSDPHPFHLAPPRPAGTATAAGGSTHFGDLPQELQQEIAERCDIPTLRQLHLSSKEGRDVAREALLGRLAGGGQQALLQASFPSGSRLELRVGGVGEGHARQLIRALAALPARITQLSVACNFPCSWRLVLECWDAAAALLAGRAGRQLASCEWRAPTSPKGALLLQQRFPQLACLQLVCRENSWPAHSQPLQLSSVQSLSIAFWDLGAGQQVDWDCLLGATQLSSLQVLHGNGPDLPPQITACTALEQLATTALPQQLQALAGLRQLRDLQLKVESGVWKQEDAWALLPQDAPWLLLAGLPQLERLSLVSATPCPVPAAAGPGAALQALTRLQVSAPGLRGWLAVCAAAEPNGSSIGSWQQVPEAAAPLPPPCCAGGSC